MVSYIGIYPEPKNAEEAEKIYEEMINRKGSLAILENALQFYCTINDILGLGTDLTWQYVVLLTTTWIGLIMGLCEVLVFAIRKKFKLSKYSQWVVGLNVIIWIVLCIFLVYSINTAM